MGNSPSEEGGVNCCVCNRRLPGCDDFDDFHKETINREVDTVYVYVYLGGKYYREVGRDGAYLCPTDFWKPRDDYRRRKEEQRRAEERRRQEQERLEQQRREEEQRRKEQERQEELRRREEEARLERERQEKLRIEAEKREEERKQREKEQQEFERKTGKKKSLADKFSSWTLSKEKENVQKKVSVQPYHNPAGFPHSDAEPIADEEYAEEFSLWSEEDLYFDDEEIPSGGNDGGYKLLSKVQSMILETNPSDDYIDVPWLIVAQMYLLTDYAKRFNLSDMQVEVIAYYLSSIQNSLSDTEILILSKILCSFDDIHPDDYEQTPTHFDNELPGQFLIMVLKAGYELNYPNAECLHQCVNTLASIVIEDDELQSMVKETKSKKWNAYDRYLFLKQCDEKGLSYNHQKRILLLVQAYDIPPLKTEYALKARNPRDIFRLLTDYVNSELNTHYVDLLKEIESTKLIEQDTLHTVEDIMQRTKKVLDTFSVDLDYQQRLNATLDEAKSVLQKCAPQCTIDHESLANALATLCCAVKKSQGYCPRDTQLITLIILIVSGNKQVSRLLEVMTGEGKSTVIAMFAATLAIQSKHVDIITSSPILAVRDAEEWQSFYDILNVGVTHNTDLKKVRPEDDDEDRRECYKHPIVYGTLSNFAADILREEFEQKTIRDGRRFDAVIADEVDLLMLDEGVQFTYLSHNSAVLHHLQPVIATVWTAVGQYYPVKTKDGSALYIGAPKLFSDAIFESINAEECQIEDSSQLLLIANEAAIIDDMTLNKLMLDDPNSTQQPIPESKKEAMASITIATVTEILDKLQEYLPYDFVPYVANSNGLLEPIRDKQSPKQTTVDGETLPEVKILVVENGLACTLNTRDELQEGTKAKLEASLAFSDTKVDEKTPKLILPLFLKDFILTQLPSYINSAFQCLEMVEDREYTVSTKKRIIPVDFLNSGVMQMNKKWGGGLQQMLEMKHKLCISSMSVITNFMSHVELFSRYKNNGSIYGLSGTLGMDSPDTARVLNDLFNVRPCTIPTFKRRKRFERPAIIVEGGIKEWYDEISAVIEDAVNEKIWRNGRAALVLCEDIKTAVDFSEYMIQEKHWSKDKVHLYAHSDSNELNAIKKEFDSGEIVIATNLAGRGTNIKLTDRVNKSGGLLCIVTFLARSRRVELQAFGRTARKGKPGSVQCILKASSLQAEYQGYGIERIREKRAEMEEERLDGLLNTEVREVQLKEVLFKQHCRRLKNLYEQITDEKERIIALDATNENWGQWLVSRQIEIENLEEQKLTADLEEAHVKWPVTNFYHHIKYANCLLIDDDAKGAIEHFTKSIESEPLYAAIAYYNRAYAVITVADSGYMDAAMSDLNQAEKCLESYISEVANISQNVSIVNRVQNRKRKSDQTDEHTDTFSTQMETRMQIFGFVRDKIRETVGKIQKFKDNDDDIEAEALGVFSLIPDADYATNQELLYMWQLGIEVVFDVKKKPRFCWEGLVVLLIGVTEIVMGAALAVLTVGAAANFGMALIAEGISDCIDGVVAMATGEFSWAEWGIAKAAGIAVSLATGGIGRFASKGFKAFKVASKLGKQLKAIPKVARSSWGAAAKTNLKNVAKHVGKSVAEEAVLRGVGFAQDEVFEKIYDEIGKQCKKDLENALRSSFNNGYLGSIVDREFAQQLPQSYIVEDKMSPAIRKRAKDFFTQVGNEVLETLVADEAIKRQVTSASLSLLSQLSSKHKGHKLTYQMLEAGEMTILVTTAITDLQILIEKLVPETENICKEFCEEEQGAGQTNVDLTKYSQLQCVATLKNELIDSVGDVFAHAVSSFLQQNLGAVVSHGLNRTVNKVGSDVLQKFMNSNATLEKVKAGQRANYIRSVAPSKSDRIPAVGHAMAAHFSSRISDVTKPGSVLELKIAVEHYQQQVTIYRRKKNGKLVRDCAIEPSSGKTKSGSDIQLLYIPPDATRPMGHYDVILKGKVVEVESDDSNCLFQAFASGRNPHLTSSKDDLDRLKADALEVRKNVAGEINKHPDLWVDHISQRLELTRIRSGERFALLGAGKKNPKTKVYKNRYTEIVHGKELHTLYEQVNGVSATGVRKYGKDIGADKKGYLISKDGKPVSRIYSMATHMTGLNFVKNVGRCFTTAPVSGEIKRVGGKAKDSTVSFHLCPSEAGANAGNAFANAVMTSTDLNKKERGIWTPKIRKWIGGNDFEINVTVKTEPIMPEGSFSKFFSDMNIARLKDGKKPIPTFNEAALKKRFEAMVKIDPRGYRVTQITYEIICGGKQIKKSLGKDWDLYVPKSFEKPVKSHQLPGEDLDKSEPKAKQQTVNQPLQYKVEVTATAKGVKEHQKRVDEYKAKHSI